MFPLRFIPNRRLINKAMNVVILHAGTSGFFPRYYEAIASAVRKDGGQVGLLVPHSGRNMRNVLPNQRMWGTRLNWFIHSRLHKLFGVQDIFSFFETIDLIRKIKAYKPDVIHFNVINDKIINMPLLVRYINRNNIPVIWTQHDCRAFTGQCTYFDEVNCSRWKIGCGNCPICETLVDNTHFTWLIRRKYHVGIKKLILVTPSLWLADFVKESFFKVHLVRVIYNGVDIERFSKKVNFNVKEKYDICKNKKIVLGCAIAWEGRKGMNYFKELSLLLPDNYQIVLVGNIDNERKMELINKGIICTGRTNSFEEMVAWYQTASVFCNPTLADNFPTVNIEALASGTPVVTFKTGGSPEAIDEKTGIVVSQGDVDALCKAVIEVVENPERYSYENCILRSQKFSNNQYDLYIRTFHEILNM